MIPTQNTQHKEEARALVIDQFRSRPVIQGILDSWMNRIQALEDALFDVIESRYLDNAIDAQLDSLGDLVGEDRQGRSDTDYRESIRLRIKINRSNGKAEDVIQTANVSTSGNFKYMEVYPAGFYVFSYDIPAPKSLQKAIGQVKAAGTKGVLVSSSWDESENFVYGSVYGSVAGENGFGSVYTSSIVSKLTSGQEALP